jgi:NAD(P)-dependent dehydrogenase (short-subunit alcohol dehydrogenase family)
VRGPLDGKRILITGGAGLLGIEHGVAVATRGGLAILVDIDQDRLSKACAEIHTRTGCEAIGRIGDVTSRASLENLRAQLEKNVGVIDGLVNNAAINPSMSQLKGEKTALETYPVEAWNAELEVGLTGALLCTQIYGARMAARGKGVIVNIASDLAVFAPDHRIYTASRRMEDVTSFKPVSYSVCKTALIGLTKYVATYWAHQGVRCNALAPAGVFNAQSDVLLEGLKERIPMRRIASRDEYQGALVFLLSDASSYMTGQTLIVDGGRSVW